MSIVVIYVGIAWGILTLLCLIEWIIKRITRS